MPEEGPSLRTQTASMPISKVVGDVDLLFLALYNLVSNAAKYSHADSSIEIRGSEDDGWAVIDVADNGAGIPANEVDMVWDELARGANSLASPARASDFPSSTRWCFGTEGGRPCDPEPGREPASGCGCRLRIRVSMQALSLAQPSCHRVLA